MSRSKRWILVIKSLQLGKKKSVAEVVPGPVDEPVQLQVVDKQEPFQGAENLGGESKNSEKPKDVAGALEKGQQKIADKMSQKAAEGQQVLADTAAAAQETAAATVNAGVAALLGEEDEKKEDDKLVAEQEVVFGGRRRRRKSTKKKKKRKKRRRKKKTKKRKRRRRKGMAGVLTPHTTGGPFPIWIDSPPNKAPMPGGSRRKRR